MKDLVKDFPNQLRKALERKNNSRITESQDDILNIVIAGLGGSGIGASIVQSVVEDELKMPITIIKGYDLPRFVDYNTLVICSSFSGNTEETLSVYEQAKDFGAKICVISSGGKLLELAKSEGCDYAVLPNEIQSPRANIGFSIVQLLRVLLSYGYISNSFEKEVSNAIQLINNDQTILTEKSKAYAKEMVGKIPIFYSGTRFYPVIIRNQQQINENAKQLCHINMFPEMNHNELVGWEFPDKIYQNAVLFMFHSDFDHPSVRRRMKICMPIFANKKVQIVEFYAKGASFLEQAFYTIHLFDLVSCELADLNNTDPNIIEKIDYIKSELSKIQ